MSVNLGLGLQDSVVVVTGAAGQIGQGIVQAFLQAECFGVAALDIEPLKCSLRHKNLIWYRASVTDEVAIDSTWQKMTRDFGRPAVICVHAAALDLSFIPHFSSITDMPVERFATTMTVNTIGSFIVAKAWLKALKEDRDKIKGDRNMSLIIMGSEAGSFGVVGNPDYSASKAALVGLMLSVAPEVAKMGGRANLIAPGAVNTAQFRKECADDPTGKTRWVDAEATVALGKPVEIGHVAKLALMLASDEWSGSTTAQIIQPNAGKSGRLFWDMSGESVT